jgi:hypothetical protein
MNTPNTPESILAYLKTQMPAYPFDPQLDAAFVEELIADFADFDILEEAKTFRWYYNNCPASRLKNLRAGLRRWIANSRFRTST